MQHKSGIFSKLLILYMCLLRGCERTNPISLSLLLRWRHYVAYCVCLIYRSRLCPNCAAVFCLSLLTSATVRQQQSSRASCYRRYITVDYFVLFFPDQQSTIQKKSVYCHKSLKKQNIFTFEKLELENFHFLKTTIKQLSK